MLHSIRSPLDGFASPFGPRRRPSWVPERSLWAFRGDDYWREGRRVSLSALMAESRSGTALALMADGSYWSFGANTPIIRPVLGLDGWGGFTNLVARLNPTVAQLPSTSNLTDAAGFAGFGNSVRFAGGGVSRWGYQTPTIANGVAFAAAFLIYMEDGNPPVFGSGTAASELNTFAIVVNSSTGGIVPTNFVTRDLGSGVYRVSVTGTTPSSGSSFGIVQYNTNKNRAFRVNGYTLVTGSVVPPPIPGSSDTGGATRNASNLTVIDPASLNITRPRFVADVNIDRLSASAARTLYAAGVDADNLIRVFLDTDNRIKARMRKSASDIWTLQSGVIGSTGIRRVEVNFSPGANSLTVEGVTGDSNTAASALPTLTTWRLLSNFGAATPWNGNVPLISLGQAA